MANNSLVPNTGTEDTGKSGASAAATRIQRAIRLPLSSLRARLLALIAFATLPAVLFIFFVAARERTALLERLESDARHVASLASREHRQQIRGARELLRWLGKKLSSEDTPLANLTDSDFLQALLAGHPQLANIGLLSPDGHVLASAYPLSNFPTMADNPAFLAALESNDVATGTYIVSPIFDRATLNYAYAVRDAGHRVLSVLFCGLDLNWLSHIAEEVEFPGPFSLLITDQDGRVLTYANSPHPEIAVKGTFRLPGVAALSASGEGKLLTLEGLGVRRYFVSARLKEDPNLHVAVSLPYDQVMRESNFVFYRTLGILALLTLFTTMIVYFATEVAVLRALRILARTVRRFGAGELTARVPLVRGYNELASLARSFNTMADALAARHAEAQENQARLRALSERLRQAREMEAARISRELHDEIGQLLTSLKFGLARLPAHCTPADETTPCADVLKSSVDEMNQQITAALDFVRRIAGDLRPSVLDKLGLAAGLEWQANKLASRTGLSVRVEAGDFPQPLSESISVTLFRIAQEALTNVVRHAEATVAEVRLHNTEDGVLLEIWDNGKGMAKAFTAPGQSLGIVGMRERAILIGGSLSIQSDPGHGTTVSVSAPLTTHQDEFHANPARG